MIVVSDTSPLNYLVLIEQIECLPRLFDRVLLPGAVQQELLHPETPAAVRAWILSAPEWVEVHPVQAASRLDVLGPGEAEAIPLAEEMGALLLMDDLEAREAALERGILVTGTLGVLERAATAGLLELPEVLARLRATTFRLSARLESIALQRDRQRRERRIAPPPPRPEDPNNSEP